MPKGNKGEWGEFYAFVKLLTLKKIHAANKKLEADSKLFFPLNKIRRGRDSTAPVYELISGGKIRVRQAKKTHSNN